MDAFEDFGNAMLLAQEGRQQIYRELRRTAARFGGRLKNRLLGMFSKTPATEMPRT